MNNFIISSVAPEISIENSTNFAGGLGTLEGDKFYETSKMSNVEYKVFSLLYRNGYVTYEFDSSGNPQPMPQPQPKDFLKKLKIEDEFKVRISEDDIEVVAFKFSLRNASAIFFDIKSEKWRFINDRLYIENSTEERFYKYVFLAKAIKEYIQRNIDINNLKYIDLQESYTAILPLIFRFNNYRYVIHTPGRWGHPEFPKHLFKKEFGFDFFNDPVVLTEIGNAMANKIFCVSKKHFEIISKMFPHFYNKIDYVTNGINLDRWMHDKIRASLERKELNLEKFIKIKEMLRKSLEEFIYNFKPLELKDSFVVAWSRRIVEYKRPDFIIRFIKRNKDLNMTYIIAGKSHPFDTYGLKIMKELYKISQERKNVVFIPEYNTEIAKTIIQGVDLFLFTPLPHFEASGTSFMKAGANGTPILTSLDGAVPEIIKNENNSWVFGDENNSSYELFEAKLKEIYKIFYDNKDRYYNICINAISSFVPLVDIKRTLLKYYPEINFE